MNILETFYIRFLSNAKEVQKDTETAGKSTDNLEKKINATGDASKKTAEPIRQMSKNINEAADSTDSLSKAFGDLLVTGIGAFSAFQAFGGLKAGIGDSISYNAQLDKTRILTGESASDLAALDDAFTVLTGNKGEFINWFTQNATQLNAMGISAENVASSLKGISNTIRALPIDQARTFFQQFAAQTGAPSSFFQVLLEGGDKLDESIGKMHELNSVTNEGAKAANELTKAWNELEISNRGYFNFLSNTIDPIATKVVKFLTGFVEGIKAVEGLAVIFGKIGVGNLFNDSGSTPAPAASKSSKVINAHQWGNSFAIDGPAPPDGLLDDDVSRKTIERALGKNPTDSSLSNDPEAQKKVLDLIENAHTHINESNSAIGGGGGVNSVSNNRSVQVGDIHVHTQASSPDGIGDAVVSKLQQEYRTTISNSDDSIAR